MKKDHKWASLVLAIIFIIGAALLRLVPHVPNFAPITAIALFGGAYLNKRFALAVPFLAMLISDYLLLYINPFSGQMFNFSQIHPVSALLHPTTFYVWGSFLVSGLIGLWLRKRREPLYIISGAAFASIQFFLITNFGVWAAGMYSRGLDGLLTSYIMALPFFRWTLLGDFFYTGAVFASYEFALRLVKKPNLATT